MTVFSGSTLKTRKRIDKLFAFQLESAVYERTNRKKTFDEQTLILLAEIKTTEKLNYDRLTHAYVHLLADVQFGGFAPAFTLSFHDSEYARKPPNAHSLGR